MRLGLFLRYSYQKVSQPDIQWAKSPKKQSEFGTQNTVPCLQTAFSAAFAH